MSKIINAIIILLIALINFFIILFPEEILIASKNGILLWSNNILPTILPFLICANILILSGYLEIISTLLENITKKIFNLPGIFIFIFFTGIISGYPVGAKLVFNLKKNNKISDDDANNLIAFCNNPGIIFILGTVAVTMLKNKRLGYFLILANYISTLLIASTFGFFSRIKNKRQEKIYPKEKIFFKLKKAIRISKVNRKPIGYIISTSVSDSIESTLQICGFIVLFSVITKIIEIIKLCDLIYILKPDFLFKDLNFVEFKGFFISLIELTNGSKILCSQKISRNLISILSSVISFGGFSVHAQTISIISKSNISKKRYMILKTFISIITFFISYLIFGLIKI